MHNQSVMMTTAYFDCIMLAGSGQNSPGCIAREAPIFSIGFAKQGPSHTEIYQVGAWGSESGVKPGIVLNENCATCNNSNKKCVHKSVYLKEAIQDINEECKSACTFFLQVLSHCCPVVLCQDADNILMVQAQRIMASAVLSLSLLLASAPRQTFKRHGKNLSKTKVLV